MPQAATMCKKIIALGIYARSKVEMDTFNLHATSIVASPNVKQKCISTTLIRQNGAATAAVINHHRLED